jgi:hypothetical protein
LVYDGAGSILSQIKVERLHCDHGRIKNKLASANPRSCAEVSADVERFVMGRIGQGLREHYEVPKEVPPKLQTLVRKLDDRDWLLPSVSWSNDRDLLGG